MALDGGADGLVAPRGARVVAVSAPHAVPPDGAPLLAAQELAHNSCHHRLFACVFGVYCRSVTDVMLVPLQAHKHFLLQDLLITRSKNVSELCYMFMLNILYYVMMGVIVLVDITGVSDIIEIL